MAVGENIRRWYQRWSYSQPKLAKKAQLSLNTANRIDNGLHVPRPMTIGKFAEVLKVDPTVLWGLDTSKVGKASGSKPCRARSAS